MSNFHPLITSLELQVLGDILAGRDPYGMLPLRVVSQTIARLRGKELVEGSGASARATDAGRKAAQVSR